MLKPKKIRLLLAIAIVMAGLFLIVTIILKVEQVKPLVKRPANLPLNVEMALNKAHYSEIKDGAKKWDLFADQTLFDKEKEAFHLKGVRLILVAEAGIGDIVLIADQADYYSKSKNVYLSGNVIAKSDSGMQFSSEKVAYIADKDLIRTDDPVKFSDSRIRLRGVGMELKTSTRDVRVMKDVTAYTNAGVASAHQN